MTYKQLLEQRWSLAIKKVGGSLALLNLPKQIKDVLGNTTDLKVKVEVLERYIEAKEGR